MHLINDDIVISGVGGAFPKARNIEEFKNHLFNNENLLETRWKFGERGVTNLIGIIPTEYFDNAYFGIHRQQCTYMDPMQRIVLETTFEALIDAGVNPSEVRGKRIGCFMASAVGENDNLFLESIISGFGVTGHSRAMLPNRVSYWLNLKGPSVAYDSNWIGGIEVLKLAYDAIKTGQCDSVIVGAGNLALHSEFQWLYADMGLISPDGSIKPFDADAKGYTRSDGVVVFYIQRASDAKRSYASIVKAATCFNGLREGNLLNIDLKCMIEFLNEFYKNSDIDPSKVDFIEAYGASDKKIDKVELEALEEIYCKKRKYPLLVGSVKPNTGHGEAVASLFSVVKVLIAMEAQKIPATIQYEKPNPDISALMNGTIEVVKENTNWDGEYAAVNCIGIDSYFGHLLLKANSKKKQKKQDDIPRLVLASTRTEDGIKNILETVISKPEVDPEYVCLINDLFSKPILGHLYRGYAILGEEAKRESEYYLGNKRQTWFVYSGMGSQWAGMASDFMKLPIFAKTINECHKILLPKGINLIEIITTKDKTVFDNILHSFVGIAAIQIALTDMLHAIGIIPDGIIGHSVGELGCAYADGCLTAEQMILSAYSRGRASLEAELIKGMMAAVGMGYNQIKDKCPPSIEVACHNGPDSSTISGPTEDMEKFVKQLQDQGVFARLVNVSNIAYHSRYIKPAAPTLLKYLKEVIPTPVPRSSKWVSTSNLEENWETDLAKSSSAEYHTNNLLSSVLFEEGLKHIPKDSILIEIAPHGLLQAILKRSLKSGCTNVPLTQRGAASGIEYMLSSLGKLYLAGINMNVNYLFPPIEYPVSKGTASLASLVHWEHSESWRTGLEGKLRTLVGVKDVQVTINSEEFRECVGHQLDDKIILPSSAYLNVIYSIIGNINTGHKDVIFENLDFKKVIAIPKIGSVQFHAMIQKGTGEFEISSGNSILVTGKMSFPNAADKFLIDVNELELREENIHLSDSDIYNEFQHRGHRYSGLFKNIKGITIGEEGSVATIQWNTKWTSFVESMIQQHLLLDGERTQEVFVPKTIEKIVFSQNILPAEKKDMKVTFEYSTNIISAEGIQIIGLKAISIPKEAKAISLDSIEFVPFNSFNTNMENCINIALQLTLDNFSDQIINNITVNEIESNNGSLLDNVTNVLNQYTNLNPNMSLVKEAKMIVAQLSIPLLIIYNDIIKDDIVKLISSCHGFLLVRTDKSLLSYPQIVQIGQFSVNEISYSIVRKAKIGQPSVVLIKGDTLSIKDLSRSSVSWVNELDTAVTLAKSKQNSIFLISSIIPTEGIMNFKQEIMSLHKMSSVRLLFHLDKKTVDINLNDPFYQTIFIQDLALTVFRHGILGSYLPIPVKIKDNIYNNFSITSNTIKNKTINYIGINLNDETLGVDSKPELGNIEYSGTSSSGQRIMGLAQMDKENFKLIPDPILSWTIPKTWTLEDSATIPHAYASAYLTLIIKAKLQPNETVLIHGGCTAVGLAAISLATKFASAVYTTVSTEIQRAYLKRHFPLLNDSHILSSNNSNFEPHLMVSTGGKGANVIINCLTGSLLQASLTCLADFGRFIQIGKFDLKENSHVGMFVFLRNTSFYVVNLDNIFNLSNEIKEEIRSLVENGIENYAIRAISRKVVEQQDIDQILNTLKQPDNIGKVIIKVNESLELNKFILNKPNTFVCDSKSSYLVYGGSADLWADVIEWLILRGARKIVISSESKSQQTHINRRLSLLQTYYGADIVVAPNKAHTREGAAELLSKVYFLGPIHAVFLLPNKNSISKVSDIKPVQYIDYALRTTAPKALFINFISNAAGVCQLREDAGFYTYNIQWQKDLGFPDALSDLDNILQLKVKNIYIKNDKISDLNEETSQFLFKKVNLLIPSLEDIIESAESAPAEPNLIQLVTIGPREIRELCPIFIIPGISGFKETQELSYKLMYPTFYAVLPSKPLSIQEMAASLYEKITKIWPKGPYNIVGISWGGALTVEIARIFSENNASLHLYFIDGAPNFLQSVLKYLGDDGPSMETNLLTRVFNINNNEIMEKIKAAATMKSKIKIAIDHYEGNVNNREKLEEGILTLYTRIQNLISFQPTEDLVTGQIHLIRPIGSSKYDNCGLLSYCKQTPQVTLVNGDHLSIINSLVTAEYINSKHYVI